MQSGACTASQCLPNRRSLLYGSDSKGIYGHGIVHVNGFPKSFLKFFLVQEYSHWTPCSGATNLLRISRI
jgi:hypothetical protein